MPHPTPTPVFAPVDKLELAFGVEVVSNLAVLLGELEEVFDGIDELELEAAVDGENDELEDVVVSIERLDVVVGAEVDIVAPDEPKVTTSVLNCTRNRPIPESQHPFV